MDHLMPGMDGFQAVQAIKNNPRTATIPIMMYTSQEGELYLGQARALGAVGVLPKQIKQADVSKVLVPAAPGHGSAHGLPQIELPAGERRTRLRNQVAPARRPPHPNSLRAMRHCASSSPNCAGARRQRRYYQSDHLSTVARAPERCACRRRRSLRACAPSARSWGWAVAGVAVAVALWLRPRCGGHERESAPRRRGGGSSRRRRRQRPGRRR